MVVVMVAVQWSQLKCAARLKERALSHMFHEKLIGTGGLCGTGTVVSGQIADSYASHHWKYTGNISGSAGAQLRTT
ncbi:hypothetical protein GCM10023160_04510 [Brachybacterium paraconglomeratum]